MNVKVDAIELLNDDDQSKERWNPLSVTFESQ